jgi:hypothetical protein
MQTTRFRLDSDFGHEQLGFSDFALDAFGSFAAWRLSGCTTSTLAGILSASELRFASFDGPRPEPEGAEVPVD